MVSDLLLPRTVNTDLVRLFPVLMFYFIFKSVKSVHILGFVVSAIDEHPLRAKPCI